MVQEEKSFFRTLKRFQPILPVPDEVRGRREEGFYPQKVDDRT